MLSPIYCPGAIEEFVDLVVPELQRRGLVRKEYRGRTMRELLRQEDVMAEPTDRRDRCARSA